MTGSVTIAALRTDGACRRLQRTTSATRATGVGGQTSRSQSRETGAIQVRPLAQLAAAVDRRHDDPGAGVIRLRARAALGDET